MRGPGVKILLINRHRRRHRRRALENLMPPLNLMYLASYHKGRA